MPVINSILSLYLLGKRGGLAPGLPGLWNVPSTHMFVAHFGVQVSSPTCRSQPVVCMSPASPTPCLSLILSFLLFYFNTRAFTVEIDGAQGWLFSSLHRNICGDGSARPLSTLVSSSFKPEPGAVSQPLPVSIFLRAKETGPVSVWSERALHC